MAKVVTQEIIKMVPHVLKTRLEHFWFDYDKEADVLYISFGKPQEATDSKLLDNDILLREKNGEVIGLTVMHASKFGKE